MKTIYIVTGAAGHLAGTIIKILSADGKIVRGLILPGEKKSDIEGVTYYEGDVTKPETLEKIFSVPSDCDAIVIHAAGIISISSEVSPKLYDVNVNGTRNICKICSEKSVKRLVYVSSVHAIPEARCASVVTEVNSFSRDRVEGAYAKTKAEASQIVLDAAAAGLGRCNSSSVRNYRSF